eukprot:TRINITY_DN5867_c0_g1_i1.p1 TRINITY_DN5867_c0_g1~~TRINITY_DN5867_c0_g1_i1.p1  ORF type:complete len:609 (-),score=167.90 TRINITY_DN5867_c0_g1_i1:46-1605(-)
MADHKLAMAVTDVHNCIEKSREWESTLRSENLDWFVKSHPSSMNSVEEDVPAASKEDPAFLSDLFNLLVANRDSMEVLIQLEDMFFGSLSALLATKKAVFTDLHQRQANEMDMAMTAAQHQADEGDALRKIVTRHVREVDTAEDSWSAKEQALHTDQRQQYRQKILELLRKQKNLSSVELQSTRSERSESHSVAPSPPLTSETPTKQLAKNFVSRTLSTPLQRAASPPSPTASPALALSSPSPSPPLGQHQPQQQQSQQQQDDFQRPLMVSFTAFVGQSQLKTLYNIRLVAGSCSYIIKNACAATTQPFTQSALGDPSRRRRRTLQNLYSTALAAVVLPATESFPLHKEFVAQCLASTEFHFETVTQQLRSVAAAATPTQPLEKGDFYVTRHSNLLDVHLAFHVIVTEGKGSGSGSSQLSKLSAGPVSSSSAIYGRQAQFHQLLSVCAYYDVADLVLPIMFDEQLADVPDLQLQKQVESVVKQVKGFLGSCPSCIKTVTFMLPERFTRAMLKNLHVNLS